jgi:RNA-directed DNA polymerase
VVETDIADCFTAIPHEKLIQQVEKRVVDQSVLKLLRLMLGAGVMADGQVRKAVTGTPQGGVISPLLCNVYLHQVDEAWRVREHGVMIRYADDVLVMCATRQQAEAALERLRQLLAEIGLEPKEAKTRIVRLVEGGEGFDFLGFHHRLVRSKGILKGRGTVFLARWPSDRAMRHARDRIGELTDRCRLLFPVASVVGDLNRFLAGWAAYFRYGHSTVRFDKIRQYALYRLALFVGKRHKRGLGWGKAKAMYTPGQLGLISLNGIVAAPRANQPWRRDKPNAGGERRR